MSNRPDRSVRGVGATESTGRTRWELLDLATLSVFALGGGALVGWLVSTGSGLSLASLPTGVAVLLVLVATVLASFAGHSLGRTVKRRLG